jgi:ribonucleoside-diphosphate reductase alpha chain
MGSEISGLMVVKRNGEIVDFDPVRIKNAILKAFRAIKKPVSQLQKIENLVLEIITEIESRFTDFYPNVENIQDIVEKHLVKNELYEVAKEYILYRAERQKAREEERKKDLEKISLGRLKIRKDDGRTVLFDINKLKNTIKRASRGFEKDVSVDLISNETIKSLYDGIKTNEVERALILAAVSFIERDPAYRYVAARLFLQKLYKEVIGKSITSDVEDILYRETFIQGIKTGVKKNLFDKKLLDFDLVKISKGLMPNRDELFQYMGVQTLYERYFVKTRDKRLELPQSFWMRVAMGLAMNETNKEERALEFYELLSSLRFVSSTPTLFHSGTTHPQLSSCYLTTINDDLNHIFKCIGDNAQLSKWSGGLGNDWTSIRGTGSWIKSTNVESQGVIPFLKIANDVTMAINRSGKRRGATCAYLETWHYDIEDFLDLRKNTGDDRRRTHDMNTANWIPDLFMKRVMENGIWTLFSPDEVPELHNLYGKAFEEKYSEYESKTKKGEIRKFKTMPAIKLWRKMLSMLFETGHPWMTFKDPCNIRSPQDHVGVVHSSNLCTEITLNTSDSETAVCNLGSINLERHVIDKRLDVDLLITTVKIAIRMLDNVIDINYYPTIEAKNSNFRHRPIGLGIMGVQDALFKMDLNFDSNQAVEFSDQVMEVISYNAILYSSELAKEKGKYESYKGSKWDRNIFPIDSLELLEKERGVKIDVPRGQKLDWNKVREHVKLHGMRNSNTMAIAPTATISNIAGCFPCIEPIYKNIYVKSNISGEFTVVNSYLINDLKNLELWNDQILDQIKYFDGNISLITQIPQKIKDKYKEAFEIDGSWIIKHAAVRNKWIDQSQSINIFLNGTSGKKLNDTYLDAWKSGLKTTYYLRSLAASQIEKSTLDANKYGFTQKRSYENLKDQVVSPVIGNGNITEIENKGDNREGSVCKSPDDPDCEACQ